MRENMSNNASAIATTAAKQASILDEYTEEQISILRNNVASPDFTNDELAYCLTVAKARKLDPFKKQVYFAKRRKKVGDDWVWAVTVEPTIDGFRVMAERTSEVDGYEGPFWCGPDGVWHDAWLQRTPPTAAKIVVHRKQRSYAYTAVARYEAYVQTQKDGKPNHMWQKMPDNQLAKCAEALALRKAFPDELGEFYTHEEMGQADAPDRFASLKPEDKPAQNVVKIEGRTVNAANPARVARKADAVERPKEKKGEGLGKLPKTVETIPAAILLSVKPLQGLDGIKLADMTDDDLELVLEQMRKVREIWKVTATSQRALDWLDAIGATAKSILDERNGRGAPPDQPDPPEHIDGYEGDGL